MRTGWLWAAVLVCGCVPGMAQRNGALERRLEAMGKEPAVAGAHWGVAVRGMDGGVIASVRDGELFEPASNNKLLTTAAAMALLGASNTAQTAVVSAGTVAAGTLTGDLVLRGGGDANFGEDDVPYEEPDAEKARVAAEAVAGSVAAAAKVEREAHPLHEVEALADKVVAAGVKVVTGNVVGDDTRWAWEPYAQGWVQDDLLWYYGAPVSALAMHDSQIEVMVRPGTAARQPGVVVQEAGVPAWFAVDATRLVTGAAGTGVHVGMDRGPGGYGAGVTGLRTLRVWGSIAVDAKEDVEYLAVDDPAEWAARALKAALEARGVEVRGAARARHRWPEATEGLQAQAREGLDFGTATPAQPAVEAGSVLGEVASPALGADVVLTNKVSQNLHAEMLLMRLGERFGAQTGDEAGTRAQGVRVVRQWMLGTVGVGAGDVALMDGSGLSLQDLVAPRALATLLVYAAGQPWGTAWRASLPVAGVDGSLTGRFVTRADGRGASPVRGMLSAKTGTTGEVRTLTGYLRCRSGREVVVSVMVNDHLPGGLVPQAAGAKGPVERLVMDRMVEAVWAAE